jgi:hypothetical protein
MWGHKCLQWIEYKISFNPHVSKIELTKRNETTKKGSITDKIKTTQRCHITIVSEPLGNSTIPKNLWKNH